MAYAVLIYETFNRPLPDRWLEKWILFPLGLARTLGPMQVSTNTRISDAQSVALGVERLSFDYQEAMAAAVEEHVQRSTAIGDPTLRQVLEEQRPQATEYAAVRTALVKYNPDAAYASEVMRIYEELKVLRPDHAAAVPDSKPVDA